jgi:hypothetical protein
MKVRKKEVQNIRKNKLQKVGKNNENNGKKVGNIIRKVWRKGPLKN